MLASGDGSFEWREWFAEEFVVDIDVDLGGLARFFFQIQAELGMEIGVAGSIGGIDTDLTYAPSETFLNGLRGPVGTAFSYLSDTQDRFQEGAFSTDPATIEFYIDMLYKFTGVARAMVVGIELVDNPIIILPGPGAETNVHGYGTIGIFSATPNGIGLFENILSPGTYLITAPLADTTLALKGSMRDPGMRLDIRSGTISTDTSLKNATDAAGGFDLTFDLATLRFKLPQTSTQASYMAVGDDGADHTFSGSSADNIAAPRLDIDGVLTYIFRHFLQVPITTEVSFECDTDGLAGELNIALLDVDAGPDLRLRQEVDLRPGPLQTEPTFFDLTGQPTTVGLTDAATARSCRCQAGPGNGARCPPSSWTRRCRSNRIGWWTRAPSPAPGWNLAQAVPLNSCA